MEVELEPPSNTSSDELEQLGSFWCCATCDKRPIGFSPPEATWNCLDCAYLYSTREEVLAAIAARAERKTKMHQSITEGERFCLTCEEFIRWKATQGVTIVPVAVATWANGKLIYHTNLGGIKSRRGEPLEYYCKAHYVD